VARKEKRRKRAIVKREESYGGSFRAARLSGGCYRSHRTTGGLLVVTYHSHPIHPSSQPSIHTASVVNQQHLPTLRTIHRMIQVLS